MRLLRDLLNVAGACKGKDEEPVARTWAVRALLSACLMHGMLHSAAGSSAKIGRKRCSRGLCLDAGLVLRYAGAATQCGLPECLRGEAPIARVYPGSLDFFL